MFPFVYLLRVYIHIVYLISLPYFSCTSYEGIRRPNSGNQTYTLSPDQTKSQVIASWKLSLTSDSVWPWLACTCDDLRSLWSSSNLHASERKFFTVWPPNASRCKLVSVLFSFVWARVQCNYRVQGHFLWSIIWAGSSARQSGWVTSRRAISIRIAGKVALYSVV